MLKQIYKLTTPWGVATPWQLFRNRIVGRMVNYIYPAFIAVRPIKKRVSMHPESPRVIITFTTFPKRADKAHLCVNSVLRQRVKADKVVMYLAKDEFPTEESIPQKLRELRDRGFLDIRFCENLRSYKKIFFAAQEFKDDIIITADDDSLYPETWLEDLLKLHDEHPDCVCCYRACEVKLDDDKKPISYANFPKLSNGIKGPSHYLAPTGVGGVLYPPKYFEDVQFDEDFIKRACPNADDVWLYAIMTKKGRQAVKVSAHSTEWFTVLGSQKWSIKDENIREGGPNDKAMQNLIKEYDLDFGFDE